MEILPISTNEAGLLSTTISFGNKEYVALIGIQGTPRTQIMGLIALRILYILSDLLVWVALGSVSEDWRLEKYLNYIFQKAEKSEREICHGLDRIRILPPEAFYSTICFYYALLREEARSGRGAGGND